MAKVGKVKAAKAVKKVVVEESEVERKRRIQREMQAAHVEGLRRKLAVKTR